MLSLNLYPADHKERDRSYVNKDTNLENGKFAVDLLHSAASQSYQLFLQLK